MKVFYCSTCFECYYIHPQELATTWVYCSVMIDVYALASWLLVSVYFIKWHQVGSIYSTSKMMHGPINIRFTCELSIENSTGHFDKPHSIYITSRDKKLSTCSLIVCDCHVKNTTRVELQWTCTLWNWNAVKNSSI